MYNGPIPFIAWGVYFTLVTKREGALLRQGAYWGQGVYSFFENQQNVQNKA